MPGRHCERNRRRQRSGGSNLPKWIALAVIVLLPGGLGVFAFQKLSGRCADVGTFAVAADPAIAPVISKVADGASAKDLGCTKITVDAKASAAMAATIGKPGGAPALWLPDSSIWLVRQMRTTGSPLDSASQSVARTPVVVVAKQDEAPTFDSWLSVLKQPGLRIGNPLEDTVVQSTYDPHFINSVVVITDGANEDPNGISLDRLLATLKKEQDPARPVVLIILGITEDADANVLKQISEATPAGPAGSRGAPTRSPTSSPISSGPGPPHIK